MYILLLEKVSLASFSFSKFVFHVFNVVNLVSHDTLERIEVFKVIVEYTSQYGCCAPLACQGQGLLHRLFGLNLTPLSTMHNVALASS